MPLLAPPAALRRASRREGAVAGLVLGLAFAAVGFFVSAWLLLAVPVGLVLGFLLARRVRLDHGLPWGTIVLGGLVAPPIGALLLSFGAAVLVNPGALVEDPGALLAVAGIGTIVVGIVFVPVTIPAALAWAVLTRWIATRSQPPIPQTA